METKHFTFSKINWFAVLTATVGILTYLQTLQLDPKVMGLVVIAIGIVNYILRTYFTNTVLTTTKPTEFNG